MVSMVREGMNRVWQYCTLVHNVMYSAHTFCSRPLQQLLLLVLISLLYTPQLLNSNLHSDIGAE